MKAIGYDVVVPTVRPASLASMLAGLVLGEGPMPERIIVVDDRRVQDSSLEAALIPSLRDRTIVVGGGARGPAAARNLGALVAQAEWIAFLDDDVIPEPGWREGLARDVRAARGASASQGRVRAVGDDPHRFVKGLESGVWITADIAYRREDFLRVGGFDERFPRAYREDADLGLRVTAAGGRIVQGTRVVTHPVPPSDWWASVRRQRGNADDALMLMLHGAGWHERASVPRGARRRHVVSTACFAVGVAAAVAQRRRAAAVLLGAWAGMTVALTRRRLAGSSLPAAIATSVAIPFAATGWWLAGAARAWRLTRRPRAVLFDRDGTLIDDVPYNGDPSRVRLRSGAREALDRLRAAGVRIAMVTNQSGVARGLVTPEQVQAVNAKIEELLGPLDAVLVCAHGPDDGCDCRKPKPGLVLEAARRLGVRPSECVVIGDIGSDVDAARAAGARAVLVPTEITRKEEIARAQEVVMILEQAVARVLGRAA